MTARTTETETREADGAAAEILADLKEQFSAWRARLAEIEERARPDRAPLTRMRWQLGHDIASALERRAGEVLPTHLFTAMAEWLGCSRSQIYNLVNVGAAFSEPLPPQHWETLCRLSRIEDPAHRQIALAELPNWAPVRSLASHRPAESKIDQARRERGEIRQQQLDDVQAGFAALTHEAQMGHILLALQAQDREAVSSLLRPRERIEQIIEAALALRKLLPESADSADGSQSGVLDSASG
ncbi:MAG: hypothetical protein IMF16_00545 [Proteobacteria bacterium]|nr:hypothetical protein [Pseudomonadota bacterium]